jgi:hypothetical protein
MTIYVDNARIPATVGRIRARWSHLLTDSADTEELHQFAESLGLKRSYFQRGDRPWRDHYDLTDSVRRAAIAAGAKPIDIYEVRRVTQRRRAALEAAPACCGLHRPGGDCCDPTDCGPCCPDCPTCPTLIQTRRADAPAVLRAVRQRPALPGDTQGGEPR